MSSIQLLPEHLINQIKAGEVIERPAHLLKELLENSVDSGADKISLRIKNCGLDYLSIQDNGKGILPDELPFAFARHATSKIQNFSDLYRLKSYGFRGEALASISSIAKVTCESKSEKLPARKYVVHGGEFISSDESPRKNSGTLMIIEELFFNTPVRLKFVKSKSSEQNAMKKVIYAFILSFPYIEFAVRWDDEEKQFFSPTDSQTCLDRLKKIFPKYFSKDEVLFIKQDYEQHEIQGYLSLKSNKITRADFQFVFVNNRLITDRSLHQTVVRAMDKVWGPGRSSAYAISLKIPESSLDVNIHPNKTIVKFEESAIVFSLIKGAITAKAHEVKPYQEAEDGAGASWTPEKSLDFSKKNFWNAQYEIMQISDTAFLIKKSLEELYIFDLQKTVYAILNKDLGEEDEAMPLLINIPFLTSGIGNQQRVLEDLEKKGFTFQDLDENQVLLSAVPYLLSFFDYQCITKQLLDESEALDFSQMDSPLASVENFIHKITLETLKGNGCLQIFNFKLIQNDQDFSSCQV